MVTVPLPVALADCQPECLVRRLGVVTSVLLLLLSLMPSSTTRTAAVFLCYSAVSVLSHCRLLPLLSVHRWGQSVQSVNDAITL